MKMKKMDSVVWRYLLILCLVTIIPGQGQSKSADIEGYYKGECGPGSPCSQICRDLPSGGFVCECNVGFHLLDDQYTCTETVPNPATTIPPVLYDLEAAEKQNPLKEESLEDEEEEQDPDELEDEEESYLENLAEDSFQSDEAQVASIDNNDDLEDELDPDIQELNTLAKRSREEKDRNRGRNRDGSRRKNKDKNRKGKGRKQKTKNYYLDIQGDRPLNDVYVKEGKVNKDKSSAENEVAPIGRHTSCSQLHCKGGARCVPDQLLGGTAVRCQCPLGKEGLYCERDILVQFPKFWGNGYMAFPVLRGAYRTMSITIEFKPDVGNGLLLYSGDFPHPMSDFFAVSLIQDQVEFRFDCGTGMAKVRTQNKIERNQWNTVVIDRSDAWGWIKLNDGPQERGRTKGSFTHITFREDLYLGGYKNASMIAAKTGMAWGFVGCVRELVVNNKHYDMRQGAFVGDAIHGVDVGECSSNVCDSVKCMNGGTCVAESADSSICLCPLGTAGDKCESRIDIHVPSFSGQSYLQYLGLGQQALSYLEGEVVFKPTEPDGLILYNGYATDRTGDFISLALANGVVDFRFDLGTGPAVIRSRDPVSMNEWHVVKFKRTGRNGELTVDNQTPVSGVSKGGYTQLTLTLDMFVGGHRNFDEVAKKAQVRTAFKGCIQKVVLTEQPLKMMEEALNGVNIDNCEHPCKGQPCFNGGRCIPIKDYYRCSCPVGFESSNCEQRIVRYRYRYRYRRALEEEVTVPSFSSTSYLEYNDKHMFLKARAKKFDLQMRIRVDRPDGLLFWVGEKQMSSSSYYIAVGLRGGYVSFSYNLGSGELVLTDNTVRVDDGKWHKIRVERYGQQGYLEVDGSNVIEGSSKGPKQQFYPSTSIFLGGGEDIGNLTFGRYNNGFTGCISNVTMGTDLQVKLIEQADEEIDITQCRNAGTGHL